MNLGIAVNKKEVPAMVPLDRILRRQYVRRGCITSSFQCTEYVYEIVVSLSGLISLEGWASNFWGHFPTGPLILVG
jgi:hypothetical protein